MNDFFDTPIDKLLNNTEEKKKPVEKTMDDIIANIIKADMEVMLKHGRNGRNLVFPDPVEPQWKN